VPPLLSPSLFGGGVVPEFVSGSSLSLLRLGRRLGFGVLLSAGRAPEPASVAEMAALGGSMLLVRSPASAVSPPPPVAVPMPKATPNATTTAASTIAI
jgi:hypothetical protein